MAPAPEVTSYVWVRSKQVAPPPFCDSDPRESFELSGTAAGGRVRGYYPQVCHPKDIPGFSSSGLTVASTEADVEYSADNATGTLTLTYYFHHSSNKIKQRKVASLTFQASRVR